MTGGTKREKERGGRGAGKNNGVNFTKKKWEKGGDVEKLESEKQKKHCTSCSEHSLCVCIPPCHYN